MCNKYVFWTKNFQPFGKNVRKHYGGYFLTHTVYFCAACSAFGDLSGQQDLTSGVINPLSYLGDSFDATTDLFTAEDALKLGLDPLEIEELQMLADASIVTDPATEDSFRLERQ